ncbi:MAG TPA: PAS domain-containing protein, partial [Gemmatimonadales bacterium]|nr:PAS domain-containing protein [Gemmatimonadales bacterium]
MEPLRTDNRTTETRLGRFTAAAIPTIFGLGLAALLMEIVLVVSGSDSGDITLRNCLVTAVVFTAAVATLLAGVSRPAGARAPWLLLGLGILSQAFAFLILFFFQKTLTTFPSAADVFWLAFYPFAIAAIVLLVRRQRRSERLGVSLDAAIVATAVAAVGYELVFNGLIDPSAASDVVGGQLAYSVLDFAILVMLVFICAPSRGRVGKAYIALAAGVLMQLASDILVVREISSGTYAPGTLLDAGWPMAMLLLAFSSRLGTHLEGAGALRGRTLFGAIVIAFIVTFGLLISEMLGDRNPIVIALAALVPCLILIRLVASVQANERLTKDNEGIISAAGEGIYRNDPEGRITYANPAALEMLGYSAEEVLGQRSHELLHHTRANGAPYPASECAAAKSLTEGATRRITDELFWRKDGSSLAVDYTSTPIREGGRIVGVVTVFDDVTHQRQMKERLR